jgi:hypothetical protein
MSLSDAGVVVRQLGRAPRGRWRVVTRCSYGAPVVIATAPLMDGQPFPTLHYLTCPHLVAAISAIESGGGCESWRSTLAADPALASRLRDADAEYRIQRTREGGGVDPTPECGIGGERDPLGMKCLHAHVAAYLAGIADPVGESLVMGLARECDDARCRED